MAVPTYDQLIEPSLRHLVLYPEGVMAKVAQDEAADILGLSNEDRQVFIPSGAQLMCRNRVG